MDITRVCYKCHQEKDITDFYKNKSMPLGISYDCKECRLKSRKDFHNTHKDEINEKRRERYTENSHPILEKNRLWRAYNIDKVRARNKRYTDNNKIKIKQSKEKYKNRRNQLLREKYKNDLEYRLTCLLRHRLWETVKNEYKGSSVLDLLGCDLTYFMKYISGLFLPNMTWENYGTWHLDHILPCASFDLTNIEEQKKCFHYTNLQPLWATDNLKKWKFILGCWAYDSNWGAAVKPLCC